MAEKLLPIDCEAVEFPRELVVPYSNHAVAKDPFGITVPWNTADVCVMEVGLNVATVGRLLWPPPPKEVEKLTRFPVLTPCPFCATAR